MSKRRSRSNEDAPSKKQSRKEPQPTTVIVCGLYVEGKTAVARGLLKELKSATVIMSDLKEGRQAVPDKGAFEVKEYKTETPQLATQDPIRNVVVLAHDLARPSRIAAALASDERSPRLLTILDSRTFLDDWESAEELPSALAEA